jgi:hypothetical protein
MLLSSAGNSLFAEDVMPLHRVSVVASLAVLSATVAPSAQQTAAVASLVRVEGTVTLNGQPVAAGAPATALGDVAEFQTKDGRLAIALKRGGTFVLGPNASARLDANRTYNFNRIEMLAGSAVLLSGTSSPIVVCGTEARFSTGGVFRFDVLDPERVDGSQRCRVRVREGAASTPGASIAYVLRDGQEMVMSKRAGDMIPVNQISAAALDDLDRWAREQAGVAR